MRVPHEGRIGQADLGNLSCHAQSIHGTIHGGWKIDMRCQVRIQRAAVHARIGSGGAVAAISLNRHEAHNVSSMQPVAA